MADILISLQRFGDQYLKLGHKDRIWFGPLRHYHGGEKHTVAEWFDLIEKLRTRPVSR